MAHYLGIDIGSSAVKACAFDGDWSVVGAARVECSSGGEFRPEGWVDAVSAALGQLDTSKVAAVGLCGRGGTNVFLDDTGRVVAPSWDDSRHGQIARELRREHADLSPQAVNLAAKAEWWRREHGAVSVAFSAKDFVNHWLTGEAGTDPASGGAAGCPPLVAPRDAWAPVGSTLAGRGLPVGVPVAVGWHDGAAATFGAGAAEAGTAPVTLGTHAVFRVVTDSLPATLRKYWDLTPGLTVTGGDILGGGLAYAWASGLLRDADASRSKAGSGGVLFLPQLLGRIAPDSRREARGTWHGLAGSTSSDDMLRAVCEGVAFSLRQVRDWLAGEGLVPNRVVATGGGARSGVQAQILADVLGTATEVATVEEGCRGAALLGAVAAGEMGLEEARVLRPPCRRFEPDQSLRGTYDEAFGRWKQLQSATDSVAAAP